MRRILYCLVLVSAAQVVSGISTLAQTPTKKCPTVIVNCPNDAPEPGKPVTFTANIDGADPKPVLTYEWSVSTGKIVGGQGTTEILVDTVDDSITATVRINGLGAGCYQQLATCSIVWCRLAVTRMFDEYGDIAPREEKVRLDAFAIQLQNEPGTQGYVIAYDKRADEAQARATRAKDLIVSYYGIDPARIVALGGGYRKSRQVELWIVPTDAAPPTPHPDVPPHKTETNKGAVKRH
jgi:hypothetical protein